MIRFGILGAARITPSALIYPCMNEPEARISVMAARDRDRANKFAEAHHIREVADSYEEVVTHSGVNAIYNPLHIPAHHPWTLKALEAGKHVLVEKSFCCNAGEAQEMHQAAQRTGLILTEAFHYRYHPLFRRVKAIYDSGELGDIARVDAVFQIAVVDPDDIRMNYTLGGGVTMDIGCYPVHWVRHLTGLEPESVEAVAEVGPPQVDVMLESRLEMPGGIVATTRGDMREGTPFTATISVQGSRGSLIVDNIISPQMGHLLTVTVDGEVRRENVDRRPTFAYQLDAFIDAVKSGEPMLTDSSDAIRQMQLIDRLYESAGLPVRGLQSVANEIAAARG
jgi:predicted dehydrogenase